MLLDSGATELVMSSEFAKKTEVHFQENQYSMEKYSMTKLCPYCHKASAFLASECISLAPASANP